VADELTQQNAIDGWYTGNIDILNRPVRENEDGTISTLLSFSFYDEDTGKEVLLPTIAIDDPEEEAIYRYMRDKKHLGMFDSPEEADIYAQGLSDFMGTIYQKGDTNADER